MEYRENTIMDGKFASASQTVGLYRSITGIQQFVPMATTGYELYLQVPAFSVDSESTWHIKYRRLLILDPTEEIRCGHIAVCLFFLILGTISVQRCIFEINTLSNDRNVKTHLDKICGPNRCLGYENKVSRLETKNNFITQEWGLGVTSPSNLGGSWAAASVRAQAQTPMCNTSATRRRISSLHGP